MITRETLRRGIQKIAVEEEIEFPSINGMKTIIPFNRDWKTLLVQVSGGLDSAILLYLTTKVFKDLNATTRIIPMSIEVPTKVKNLKSARSVIDSVKNLINYPHLADGLEFSIPKEESTNEGKNAFFIKTIRELFTEKQIDFEFNGNTKNPPPEVRNSFRYDNYREHLRDNRETIYNWNASASPHAFIDKSGIVALYKNFGILEEIASKTLSCDIDLWEKEEKNLPIPCGICWWCQERAWGFGVNGQPDPSLSKA